uniref:DUF2026 family protein n=1 Tax=Paracoccus sp. T5 TaxID=3402161 RepID=UPI003AE714C4
MLIKLKDYQRIFQIVSAVVESEGGDPAHACIQYSLFGANILVDHFGADAKVSCGLAVYHLGDDHQVLCFGTETPSGITSTNEGFHCWVEADGWFIDFMAPKFADIKKTEFTARPKMFQKPVVNMVEHPNQMTRADDFFFAHNSDLSDSVLIPVIEHLGIQDLAKLCSQWFKKTPKTMQVSAATVDQNGKMRPITLKEASLRSNW